MVQREHEVIEKVVGEKIGEVVEVETQKEAYGVDELLKEKGVN